jgi:hypothetical protein
MSATVLTSRMPVQVRSRVRSSWRGARARSYWGVLLRRWPVHRGPGVQIPSLSARRRRPPVVRDGAGGQATGCASRLGGLAVAEPPTVLPVHHRWGHPVAQTWRGAREAEWAGFETRRGAILRGSKSHPLRPPLEGWQSLALLRPLRKRCRVTPTGVQIPRLPLQHPWSVNQTGVLGPRWKRVGGLPAMRVRSSALRSILALVV